MNGIKSFHFMFWEGGVSKTGFTFNEDYVTVEMYDEWVIKETDCSLIDAQNTLGMEQYASCLTEKALSTY